MGREGWVLGDEVGLTGLDFFNAEAQRSRSEHRGRTGVVLSLSEFFFEGGESIFEG